MTHIIHRDALGGLLADLPLQYVAGSVIAGYAVVASAAAGDPDGATIWGVGTTVASACADACCNLGSDDRSGTRRELPYGYVVMPCTAAILHHPDLYPLWEACGSGGHGAGEVGTVIDLYEAEEEGESV